MPKRAEMATRVKRMGKMSVDKKRQYTVVLLVMGLALSIAFASGYMPFASFYYGGDFTATVGIEGLYLPDSAVIQNYYANAGGTDTFEMNVDGAPHGVTHFSGEYAYWSNGDPVTWVDGVATDFPTYDPALDIYEDGEGGYNKWGQNGYFNTEWYPNLDGYYTMLPNIKGGLDNIEHITDDSTPDLLKRMDAGVPSATGTDNDGYYYEEYFYSLDFTVRLHADIAETYVTWSGVAMTVYYKGSQLNMHTAIEVADFKNIFFAFGLRTSGINASVTSFITDMQTFGAHEIQFYEWDEQGSFSTPIGTTYVHSALDNLPGPVPFTARTDEMVFNRDYLMTGMDPTMGLIVADSTVVPALSDEDVDYYLFSIDEIAVPAYSYRDFGVAGYTSYYDVFDLEVTFPLMATIHVGYDILTGDAAGRDGNTEGSIIVDGDDDDRDWALSTVGVNDIFSSTMMPIVLVGVVMLFLIYRR